MTKQALLTENLLDLRCTLAAPLLSGCAYPWEALPKIGEFILRLGETLDPAEYERQGENIWIHKTVKRYPGAYIAGSAIIGEGTEIRPGAFIRGNALVGSGCVVGNSTELKNVILFDGVQVPHYNYVGDSILGHRAHMGAGAVTSNVKQDKTPVTVRLDAERVETGLKKFGAILGDFGEIGCNAVLNPGAVIGRNARVYPLSMVRGLVPEGHVFKAPGRVEKLV